MSGLKGASRVCGPGRPDGAAAMSARETGTVCAAGFSAWPSGWRPGTVRSGDRRHGQRLATPRPWSAGRRVPAPSCAAAAGSTIRTARRDHLTGCDPVQDRHRVGVEAERRRPLQRRRTGSHRGRTHRRGSRTSRRAPPPAPGRRACPDTIPVEVSVTSPTAWEMPKSVSLAEPSSVISTLPGLTSRCTMPTCVRGVQGGGEVGPDPADLPRAAASRGRGAARSGCWRARTA